MKADNYNILIQNLNKYYEASQIMAKEFEGPSVYFHQKALEWQQKDFLSERHLEYVYATLVSCGMHRMGKAKTKMPDFDEFKGSISAVKNELNSWKYLKIEKLTEPELNELLPELTNVCFKIKATKSDSQLVSGSKTLAHILPDLVCPIDRNYTLDFFGINIETNKTKEEKTGKQKQAFKDIISTMWHFYHNSNDISFIQCQKDKAFCESLPKIFDNMIIAYKKNNNE